MDTEPQYTFEEFYRVALRVKFSKKSYCTPTSVAIRSSVAEEPKNPPRCRIYFSSYPLEENSARFVPTLFCCDVSESSAPDEELSWFLLVPDDFASDQSSVSLAESLLRERMRSSVNGVSEVTVHASGRMVITANGHIYCATDQAGLNDSPTVLEPIGAPVLAPLQPQICPTNYDIVACVANGQLTVGHIPSNTWTPLTHVDLNAGISVAMPSYVVQEEFNRYIGFWWQTCTGKCMAAESLTPDNVYRILYEHVDEQAVQLVHLLSGQLVESHRYPKAGGVNAISDLRICEFQLTNEGEVTHVRHLSLPRPLLHYLPGNFEYLVRAGWTPDGQYVWCQLITRTQDRLELILIPLHNFAQLVDPHACPRTSVTLRPGATGPCIRLLVEEDEHYWVSVHDYLTFLTRPWNPVSQTHSADDASVSPCDHDDDTFERLCFIWVSHRSGFSHLYLMQRLLPRRGLVGTTTPDLDRVFVLDAEELFTAQLSNGSWEVTGSQIWVDETQQLVYFEANREHPLLRHIYSVSYGMPTRGHITRLTPLTHDGLTCRDAPIPTDSAHWMDPDFPEPGTAQYPLSYQLKALDIQSGWGVLSASSWSQTTGVQVVRITCCRGSGGATSDRPVNDLRSTTHPVLIHIAWLQQHLPFDESLFTQSVQLCKPPRVVRFDVSQLALPPISADENISLNDQLNQQPVEPHTPTYLYGLLFTPNQPKPDSGFPTVHFVYGGPDVQLVQGTLSKSTVLHAALYCHFGYAVFVCDCRGSSNRGIQFAGYVKKRLGMVELDDHVAFLKYVAEKTALVDLTRVAITGCSYGGYMSLMAAMRYHNIYRAAIAGSPVVDWTLYDTAYTERYLGLPSSNPVAYWNANVLRYVDQMPTDTVRLLIYHGAQDENVHFNHTALLLHKMETTGKPFKLLYYPTSRHGIKEYEHVEASLLHLMETVLQPLRARSVVEESCAFLSVWE